MGAMRTDRGSAVVDVTEIGQPFTLKGADQNFDEWTHKARTFMLGRGDHILGALTWEAQQRKIVVKTWAHHVNVKSLSKVADLNRETA